MSIRCGGNHNNPLPLQRWAIKPNISDRYLLLETFYAFWVLYLVVVYLSKFDALLLSWSLVELSNAKGLFGCPLALRSTNFIRGAEPNAATPRSQLREDVSGRSTIHRS